MDVAMLVAPSDGFKLRTYLVPRGESHGRSWVLTIGTVSIDFPPGSLEQLHELVGEELAAAA
jgi:hypothetical protein